jgi:N6-L-threonylcarbamoyladenine synthase
MKVLAIETSCDETGIALVEGEKRGLSLHFVTLKAALLSQAALHAPYGGVYPNLAKREHQKNLPVLFEQFKNDDYDAVAVTVGPGLEPALWQGVEFAKQIAQKKRVPLLPVNHMEAHLISSLATTEHYNILQNVRMSIGEVKLPVLALLISGGHTEFILMHEWFTYEVVGETLDDAVGEAFDKVARMLGLSYPGGPEISKIATQHRKTKNSLNKSLAQDFSARHSRDGKTEYPRGLLGEEFFVKLPRPMLNSNSCDVSFSGLKTAALYALRGKNLSEAEKAAFAAEFEEAVGDVFVYKTRRALQETGARTFVIGGGVAANRYLRERLEQLVLEEFPDVDFRLPDPAITGDNAVMIAQGALARRLSGITDEQKDELKAVGNLSIAG